MNLDRAQAFADGVFAIAITLLVLEIHVPDIPLDQVTMHLRAELWNLSSNVLSYASSAAILGLYWIGHHRVFDVIKRYDNVLLWLNIAFLVSIGFLPFPSALLGRYGQQEEVVIIYAATLFICGMLLNSLWWYALRQNFIEKTCDRHQISHSITLILIAPFMFFLTTVISFFRLEFATIIYFLLSYIYAPPVAKQRSRAKH